jgi:hypothetical protein
MFERIAIEWVRMGRKEVRKDRNEEQLLSTFTVVTCYRSSETT